MNWPQLNWLPRSLWFLWRDLTWARNQRRAWLAKLQRYYERGGRARVCAIDRVRCIAFKGICWDWDDNVPEEWASVLVRRWGLKPWHIWHENRAGLCMECSSVIEHYTTKWIEARFPYRIKCTNCRPDHDWSAYVDDADDWYYWSDG